MVKICNISPSFWGNIEIDYANIENDQNEMGNVCQVVSFLEQQL
jgi:hypothetical protein